MVRFQAGDLTGVAVQQLEVLVRTAIFKPANVLVGFLLQAAAERIDLGYQPKPGQQRKGRESITVNGIFGAFELKRDYYYHEGKKQGHYPADAALGLEGRMGKQPDGGAKTCMAYLGCVFTQHKQDEEGHPMRDHESTTYVSTFSSIEEFGPLLRQEAIRRGLALAMQIVLLIDGAVALAKMGRLCFPTAIQIVDFYHALVHAGEVLVALLGSK